MGFVHYEMLGWVLQPAIQYLRVAAKCFQLEHLESQLPLLANVSTLPKVSSTTGQVLLFKGSELYHKNKTNIKQTIKHHPYPLQTSQHQQEPKSKALHYVVPQAACPSLTACLANAYTLLQKEIKQSSKDFLLHWNLLAVFILASLCMFSCSSILCYALTAKDFTTFLLQSTRSTLGLLNKYSSMATRMG